MTTPNAKYMVSGFDLSRIRNRNEQRVIRRINDLLAEPAAPQLTEKQICDVYAFALNQLSARYAQVGTIILRDPVKKDEIVRTVKDALSYVLANPKA